MLKPTDFVFELGQEVRDVVTGYTGIVRGRAQYLTGCNTYAVQTRKLSDAGKPADWLWFDENVLESTQGTGVTLNVTATDNRRGGPQSSDQVGRVR